MAKKKNKKNKNLVLFLLIGLVALLVVMFAVQKQQTIDSSAIEAKCGKIGQKCCKRLVNGRTQNYCKEGGCSSTGKCDFYGPAKPLKRATPTPRPKSK